jgi:hypothetical protein
VCVLFSFAWNDCLVLCFPGSWVVEFCSVLVVCVCVKGGLQVCFGRVVVCFQYVTCEFGMGCRVVCCEWWWVHGMGFMSVVLCFFRF